MVHPHRTTKRTAAKPVWPKNRAHKLIKERKASPKRRERDRDDAGFIPDTLELHPEL